MTDTRLFAIILSFVVTLGLALTLMVKENELLKEEISFLNNDYEEQVVELKENQAAILEGKNKEIKNKNEEIKKLKNEIKEKEKTIELLKEKNPLKVYEVTAYTNRPEEGTNGVTASGKPTVEGKTIACPPFLKLGTKIRVQGMGVYTCQDRGGAIKGNRLDVFMEDLEEAYHFGRRTLAIEILGE